VIGMNLTHGVDEAAPPEITHVRIWDNGVHWGAIHKAPDVYDWTFLDRLVDKYAGKHLTYVIAGCPRWLAKYPDNPHFAPWLGAGSNSMPFSVDEFNKFCWNLATRYKGRIKAYEVWNEPQLADFLFPYNDAECNALAAMTKRAYSTIKACDPAALVLSASVLPRASSGGMSKARRYLAAMQRKDWNVDAFTCHIYPEVGEGVTRWKSMLADVVSTLKSMGTPTSKLWITETSYGLLGPAITPAPARKLIEDTYKADGGRFIFWYAWDRRDLGGTFIGPGTVEGGPGSPAWESIKTSHTAPG
jgi:hypothetical protein